MSALALLGGKKTNSLDAVIQNGKIRLTWDVHGGDPARIIIERSISDTKNGGWRAITTLPATSREYIGATAGDGRSAAYRVHAENANGKSAYSNIARIKNQ